MLIVLATGATNKEIGEKLFISISTVKTHIIY
ncbi:helix-turn-helix transcriptional regulator [Bacillus pseudomycoides]|nr:LuxR C-terminal-related transcriptional regulator [Bacillus pseudomycoides]